MEPIDLDEYISFSDLFSDEEIAEMEAADNDGCGCMRCDECIGMSWRDFV